MQLPALRRLLIPDPGHTLIDLDLAAADAQAVAWEAGDEQLKERFRHGEDIHLANARDVWGDSIAVDTVDIRGVKFRDKAKLVHAINYGCGAPTLAEHIRESRATAQRFIDDWLSKHPNIKAWQRRVQFQLETTRTIHNVWGFRRVYTDRPTPQLLHQALAWIGQSTVAIAINKILLRIDAAQQTEGLPCDILLQDHDNLILQVPSCYTADLIPYILKLSAVPIPFADPLVIPASLKTSERSWADVKPYDPSAR